MHTVARIEPAVRAGAEYQQHARRDSAVLPLHQLTLPTMTAASA
jgi:hypothetical protein